MKGVKSMLSGLVEESAGSIGDLLNEVLITLKKIEENTRNETKTITKREL